MTPHNLPDQVEVIVEVPRGGFVKRGDHGRAEFISPFPCPFNYGSVPGLVSGDGDQLDVVLLGPRHDAGHRQEAPVWGVVRFIDAGDADPKLICGPARPSRRERWMIHAFFIAYARGKDVVNRLRGRNGGTRLLGVEMRP